MESSQFAPFALPANYPTPSPKVGQIVTPIDVEVAVLEVLSGWLPPYISEVEIDRGILAGTIPRPPGPESYRGSTDATVFQQDETPTLIVIAEPSGAPERSASAGYAQQFLVQVLTVVVQESEDEARQLASFYGGAIMGAIDQQGDLGGIAQNTRLASLPVLEFPNPEIRTLMTSRTEFDVWVQPVFDDQYSGTFLDTPTEPPFGSWPEITSTDVTVTGPSGYADMNYQSAILVNVNPYPTVTVGEQISGEGIPQGTTVTAFSSSAATITMSEEAELTGQHIAVFLGATIP